MPSQLFYTVPIPVCLWFLTKDKTNKKVKSERTQRNRKGEFLFIDARNMGQMVTRTVKELSEGEITTIADIYHAWRGEPDVTKYEDIAGFCASVSVEDIASHKYVLTPGRYVGSHLVDEDAEPINEIIARLIHDITQGFSERADLQQLVLKSLESLVEKK
jgi:type I restriction enzyme M protein